MVDLASFCNRITKKQEISIQTIEMGEPSRPFVQLLCILPSGAADILPPAYRHLMLSSDSALVKAGYYPKEYELDYEGKPAEHLAAVLLKQIDDISLVREEYQKVSKRDPNRYARNELGHNYMYHCNKDSNPYHYDSDPPIVYGNIEKCYVVVRKD
jgi:5'-3' exonuclease